MNLKFELLVLDNFKSFRGRHHLEMMNHGPGLHFVCGNNKQRRRLGANGTGKSTLWDALVWCLYGKTPGGLKNPDITPWTGEEPTEVRVRMRIDKERVTVIRKANPNSLVIRRNKEPAHVTQEQVDQLVRMNYDVFTNTIVQGQGRPLFFDLTPRGRLDLLAPVMQLEKWDERSKTASTWVHDLDGRLIELRATNNALGTQQATLSDEIDEEKKRADEFDETRDTKQQQYQKELSKVREALEAQEQWQAKYDLCYDGAETELRSIRKELDKLGVAYRRLNDRKNKHAIACGVAAKNVKRLQLELEQLGSSDSCPTCGQSLKGTKLASHKRELKEQIAAEQTKSRQPIPEDLAKALASIDDRDEHLRREQERHQEIANKARDNYDAITKRVNELREKQGVLETLLKQMDEDYNPHKERIRDLAKRSRGLFKQIEANGQEILTLEGKVERGRFWVKGFKDVRLFVVEDLLAELEMATNQLLPELGLQDWEIRYSVERETKSGSISRGMTIDILSPDNKKAVRWENWSGGEGQRLRIAGALALSEVLLNHAGVETDLEILDEPTRHLSAEGVRDLCESLADRAYALQHVIYYSDHQSVDSVSFESVIRVVKDRDGSRIEAGS